MSAASAARRRAGLTVEQVAKATGYTVTTIRNLEKPSTAASLKAAARLARIYGCEPTVFLKQRRQGRATI